MTNFRMALLDLLRKDEQNDEWAVARRYFSQEEVVKTLLELQTA